ncbi:FixH family protein [Brevibacillus sp. H7]|uniref:FixH family protein n=1 Tax=Brevibacillus sp. H7 TaxID=3349138 RepID=UPI0037F228E7
MKKLVMIVIAGLLLLAGCGTEEQSFEPAGPIEVALSIQPEAPTLHENATFSVTVTQNGALVDDAKEVKFELWKEGQEPHEMLPAQPQGQGVYSVQKAFAEPGTYYVMYHVTARDFHSMKKQTFTVTGGQPQPQPTAGHAHGTDHHHGDGVDYHFQPDSPVPANVSIRWSVHLAKEGQLLDKAAVQFEYWKNGEEKHQFVDAKEASAGEYRAQVTLPAPGGYTFKVHVEKGTIHDHKEFPVTAQ